MAHGNREDPNAESTGLVDQATALEEAAALQDSAQDPEWLAIAQNIPDGKHMQARADEEVWQALAVLDCCAMIAVICMRVAVHASLSSCQCKCLCVTWAKNTTSMYVHYMHREDPDVTISIFPTAFSLPLLS